MLPSAEIKGHRFLELDSLRGIAALIVVFHHAHMIVTVGKAYRPQLHLLVPGTGAVVTFFVLSGFVLTGPWLRSPAYLPYLAKRFSRIYLPYAAGLLLSVIAALQTGIRPIGNSWFDPTWSRPVTLHNVLYQLTGIGNFRAELYNTSYWTLVIEMRVSLVFPLIAILASKIRFSIGLLVSFAGTVLWSFVYARMGSPMWGLTVQAAFEFLNGALLVTNWQAVSKQWKMLPAVLRTGLSVTAFLVLGLSRSAAVDHCSLAQLLIVDWFVSIAAMVLILQIVTSNSVRHWMHGKIPLYLGERSYSIYLVHATVLFWMVHHFWGHASMYWILPSAICLIFPVAELFHQIVEVPALLLGRKLERHLRRPGRKEVKVSVAEC